jgi:hypothetical protein
MNQRGAVRLHRAVLHMHRIERRQRGGHNSATRLIAIVIAACQLRLQADRYRLIRGAGLP